MIKRVHPVDQLADQVIDPTGETALETSYAIEWSLEARGDDIRNGNYSVIMDEIINGADENAASIERNILESLAHSCEAAGTSMSLQGQALSHDHLIDMFERMHHEFDDKGNPSEKTWVVHPSTMEIIRNLPPPTPTQLARFEKILKEKRDDWYAQRRRRRLS